MIPGGSRSGFDRLGIRAIAACLCLALQLTAALAQQPARSPADGPQYTLHAYANLVQIPVLVLGPGRDRLSKPIPPGRFGLSIDSGPWFRPTHVRVEGDDPISLSILMDTRGDSAGLLSHITDQLAALSPDSLHPNDHLSMYSLDCTLIRSTKDLPLVNPEILPAGARAALRSWKDRTASHTRCPAPVHLQQAILYIENAMQDLPGRRVILVLSAGEDEIANPSWRELGEAAQTGGTAIFAIAPEVFPMRGVRELGQPGTPKLNLLDMTCGMSGGTLLQSSSSDLLKTLKEFVRMLRERYIVDFPRPKNSTPGRHELQVRIDKTWAFIRPAGISVPIQDPAVLADPTTVPSTTTETPLQGTRSPLPR